MSAIERASILALTAFALGGLGGFATGCNDASDPAAPTTAPAATPAATPPAPKPPDPPAAPAPPKTPTPDAPAIDADAGLADYQIYCASCHGPTGSGDGPVAATLPTKPAQHNDGNYMNPLPDDYLFKVIAEGGPAVGKSEMMAPWGGSLSDAQIRNIIAFIRTLADPPYTP